MMACAFAPHSKFNFACEAFRCKRLVGTAIPNPMNPLLLMVIASVGVLDPSGVVHNWRFDPWAVLVKFSSALAWIVTARNAFATSVVPSYPQKSIAPSQSPERAADGVPRVPRFL